MRKIVIISSGQPSANPRLVKEAVALSTEGYQIKVLYCPLSLWADPYDEDLFQQHPEIEWIKVGYHPVKQRFLYYYARFRQKCYGIFYKVFGNQNDAGLRSMVLFSQELIREAKRHQADLYIGHNLGALPAVIKAAAYHSSKAGFDFEDFHRGEDTEHSIHWEKTKLSEERYIPLLHFATAASPLIAKQYRTIYQKEVFTINNVFSKCYLTKRTGKVCKPISLFWFSQNIGKGRGLEDIIDALKLLPSEDFRLILLGNCKEEMKQYFKQLAGKDGTEKVDLCFLDLVHPDEIFKIASKFDIGLALEPGRDLNNQIALSNKLFTYLLAGNAIIFSNTPAQQLFYNQNPDIGSLYTCGNIRELVAVLKRYKDQSQLLDEHKKNALKLATEKYNWEEESKELLRIVRAVLEDE